MNRELLARMRAGLAAREAQQRAESQARAVPRLEHVQRDPCVLAPCNVCERAAIVELNAKLPREEAQRIAANEPRVDWMWWERYYEANIWPAYGKKPRP